MVEKASIVEKTVVSKPYDSYLSGEYLEKNPTWDDEDSQWKASKVLEIMQANQLDFKSIVDIGCGAGGVLAALASELSDVELHGYEIAPDASRFWSQHEDMKISFFVADFLQEKKDHYDALLLLDVFEHVPDPFEFLSLLRGRAEYYIFHIPLDLSAVSVAREKPLLHVRRKVGHIHYYTKGLALALLDECGYEIVDWSYTGASLTAPQSSWKGKMARVPRRILYSINRDFGVRLLGGDTLIVLAKAR